MKYEQVQAISRVELATELQSGDRDRISRALVSAALNEPDRGWLEDLLMKYLVHSDPWIRGIAATCTGHVARIHRALDLSRVLPLLEELRTEPATAGRAEDALDDIDVFITRSRE